MKKIIIESCNNCPYCKDHYTSNMEIYTGTTCNHKDNRDGQKIYLGSHDDRQLIHKRCPLDDADGVIEVLNRNGIETVVGYDAVKSAITEMSDSSATKLCSGYGVFPDGVKCTGCSDCRN
jgi:hypothetical protein